MKDHSVIPIPVGQQRGAPPPPAKGCLAENKTGYLHSELTTKLRHTPTKLHHILPDEFSVTKEETDGTMSIRPRTIRPRD
jgi:hypothetical protein